MLYPSTILLLLLSALGVFATLGSKVEIQTVPDEKVTAPFYGGYWFQEVDASKAKTITNKELQDGAETGYKTAKAKAPNVKVPQHPTGVGGPAIVVALFVPDHGTIIASTISTGVEGQSVQTCETFTSAEKHRSFYNCGELNAITIAVQQGWTPSAKAGLPGTLPKGSKMTVYGRPSKKSQLGFHAPCEDHPKAGLGCQNVLQNYPELEIVNPPKKRTVDFIV